MHSEIMSFKVFSNVVNTTVQLYCHTRMICILNIKYISDQQLENPRDQKSNVVQIDLPSLNFLFRIPLIANYKTLVMAELGILGQKNCGRTLARLPRVGVVTQILKGRGCWQVFAYTCEVLGGIGSTVR